MSKVYIIHENSEWTDHLTKRLNELNIPYEEWFLDQGTVDLSSVPPEGVFYSRMSASSHTRDHRFAPELSNAVLAWLEFHGRTVFNGTDALKLELSKVNQYLALEKAGIRTPKTIAAVGKKQIIEAAKKLNTPSFITKHNRAGKGLGVQLFNSIEALEAYVNGPLYEEPVDGITLIQQYIKSPESFITRAEFVGAKFVYAVQVDTSKGFELCPADACQINDLFCPVGEEVEEKPKFQIVDDSVLDLEQIKSYEEFLKAQNITVAGIEFIKDENGIVYTYDINTNTNYNSDAEAKAGKYGMLELATFLGKALEKEQALV
ncbi:alpha-L-glutamate ligase [Rummeliibacillus sp. TYF005]|uniref:ATP-grasp domain-containing protein n=1 Tax=unclassified Rummeliibacillus TaxID=2622809 RepID=UPI000E673464|nr:MULTISPECIES: alpha-L-glutamate ligase [unclassified Rummeliibacillus]RIJ63301.1 alpha-L-glutamate ligase [Rummeliibacillus sp. POC4]RPJ94302.1 alpha-L-glutamate ligase [Rummeliibacillus sp. TYF005]